MKEWKAPKGIIEEDQGEGVERRERTRDEYRQQTEVTQHADLYATHTCKHTAIACVGINIRVPCLYTISHTYTNKHTILPPPRAYTHKQTLEPKKMQFLYEREKYGNL